MQRPRDRNVSQEEQEGQGGLLPSEPEKSGVIGRAGRLAACGEQTVGCGCRLREDVTWCVRKQKRWVIRRWLQMSYVPCLVLPC